MAFMLTGICLLAISAVLLKPLWNYFYDALDLRKYPAPNIVAATTPFWLMRQSILQRRSQAIFEQHKRLGDVIRIGPRHISLNDPQAIKEIYGHQAINQMGKDVFYDLVKGDAYEITQVPDVEEHSRRRRYLAHAFALRTVVSMEPVIRSNAMNLINVLDQLCARSSSSSFSSSINIRKWINYFTLDVIGDMAMGIKLGFCTNGSDASVAQKADDHDDTALYPIRSTIHSLHQGVRYTVSMAQGTSEKWTAALKRIVDSNVHLKRWMHAQEAEDFTNWCRHKLLQRIKKGTPNRPMKDFFHNILHDKQRNDESRDLPFAELLADATTMLNAGSDTTAAALTSGLYFLISNPEALYKLRQELDEALSADTIIAPYDQVKSLPYLRACIDETLRLRPPIAYGLPRKVLNPQGLHIAGRFFQHGTTISVPTFAIHRKESLYVNPEKYDPDRWLDTSNAQQIENLRNFTIPFSTGPRACLGRNIAVVEQQILIATLVHRYEFQFVEQNQKLEIFERFNSNPGAMPVRLKRRINSVKQ